MRNKFCGYCVSERGCETCLIRDESVKIGDVIGKGKNDLGSYVETSDEHRNICEGTQVSHVLKDVDRMIEHLKGMGNFYTKHSCDYSVNYGYLKALEDVIAWLEEGTIR